MHMNSITELNNSRCINLLRRKLPYQAFIQHSNGDIKEVNQAFADLFGYDKKDLLGKNIFELGLIDAQSIKEVKAKLCASYSGVYTIIGKRSDNTNFPLEIVAEEVQSNNSEFGTRIALMRDLSGTVVAQALALEDQGKLLNSLINAISTLSHFFEARDPYTAGHQNRVSILSELIGRELKLSDNDLLGLKLGASIHDIGKIAVPTSILSKPGKLMQEEFSLIKTHASQGAAIVEDIETSWPLKEMVLQHHERIDGSGYPMGIKGDEITIEAKIIAVADTFEAITSHRPYRPSLGVNKALAVINKGKGSLYCPKAVEACTKIVIEDEFAF